MHRPNWPDSAIDINWWQCNLYYIGLSSIYVGTCCDLDWFYPPPNTLPMNKDKNIPYDPCLAWGVEELKQIKYGIVFFSPGQSNWITFFSHLNDEYVSTRLRGAKQLVSWLAGGQVLQNSDWNKFQHLAWWSLPQIMMTAIQLWTKAAKVSTVIVSLETAHIRNLRLNWNSHNARRWWFQKNNRGSLNEYLFCNVFDFFVTYVSLHHFVFSVYVLHKNLTKCISIIKDTFIRWILRLQGNTLKCKC